MKDYDTQQLEATIIMVGVIGVIMLFAVIFILAGIDWMQKTFGQDFDPCFVNNDMFQKLCDKEKNNEVIDDVLESQDRWNNLDCNNATNFDQCDMIEEDEPGYCQGNLTALDKQFCVGE
jgi:hypothetical protein